jgi:hypothetical protein
VEISKDSISLAETLKSKMQNSITFYFFEEKSQISKSIWPIRVSIKIEYYLKASNTVMQINGIEKGKELSKKLHENYLILPQKKKD